MIWTDTLDVWYITQRWDKLQIWQIRQIIREHKLLEDEI
jgi:hypothetical protein